LKTTKALYIKHITFILILIGLLFSDSFSTTGWAFLSIPHGTREVAMGETGVSHARDGSAVWWNPAHISTAETSIWFQGFRWIEDGKGSFGGAKLRTSWGGVAAYYINHGMDGFEIRNRPGPAQGEFTLHQVVFAGGAALRPMQNLSVGVVYKGAFEEIYGDR